MGLKLAELQQFTTRLSSIALTYLLISIRTHNKLKLEPTLLKKYMVRVSLHPMQSRESYIDTKYAYKLFFTVCSQISPQVCYQKLEVSKANIQVSLE